MGVVGGQAQGACYFRPLIKPFASSGHRDGSFIRMKRILRITRIVRDGVKDSLSGPGFFGNCRSGGYSRGSESYAETNKTKKIPACLREL
jgi:hypothetical protein